MVTVNLLKSLLRTNVLNDVTAALFLMSFSQLPAVKKDTKNGASVTSLRTSVGSNDLSIHNRRLNRFLVGKTEVLPILPLVAALQYTKSYANSSDKYQLALKS